MDYVLGFGGGVSNSTSWIYFGGLFGLALVALSLTFEVITLETSVELHLLHSKRV